MITLGSSAPKIAFFAAGDNFHFLRPTIDHYKQVGVQVRVVSSSNLTQDELEKHMRWSDVSWFEWCDGPIVAGSRLPKVCKIICRLHRYEVYSEVPAQVNWRNVDVLMFVSPMVAEKFKVDQIPDIEATTRIAIVPNAVDLERFSFVRRDRGHNIAFIARLHPVKNVPLLIQIVAELVRRDPRYRCYVAGRVEDLVLTEYLIHIVRQLKLENNIFFNGHVEDIPTWLEDKHYIVSTSLIESQGVNIIEAMARGMKPVIHNNCGNPAWFFGPAYVFNTVSEAVEMVLSEDYQPESYRQIAEEQFSLERQLGQIDQIIYSEFGIGRLLAISNMEQAERLLQRQDLVGALAHLERCQVLDPEVPASELIHTIRSVLEGRSQA